MPAKRTTRAPSPETLAVAEAIRAELAHKPGLDELIDPDAEGVQYANALRSGVARLKEARVTAGLTAAAVADAAGLTVETISRLETGVLRNPQWQTLAGYAAAVGCRIGLAVEPAPARPTPPAGRRRQAAKA